MLDRQNEGRVTFGTFKKISQMLRLNLTDDQVQEAIQSIAGKGKQALTWDQFNSHLAKKLEKKKWFAAFLINSIYQSYRQFIEYALSHCLWRKSVN